MMGAKPKFYIVYRTKDDSIAAVGSAEECAKQLGHKDIHHFYTLVYRIRSGKCKNYEITISDSDVCDE
jgi:hypothetical protein